MQFIRILLILFLFLLLPTLGQAGEILESKDGRKVRLKDDFTWEYVKPEKNAPAAKAKRQLNATKFVRPATARSQVSGKKLKYSIWYDPATWKKSKYRQNENTEYEFQLADGTAFGMVLAEELTFDHDFIESMILENMEQEGRKSTFVSHELRQVNGRQVSFMVFDVRFQNNDLRFFVYIYAGKNMTIQVHGFCPKKTMQDYEKSILDLLNGLEVFE